jgi:hypothetical protein
MGKELQRTSDRNTASFSLNYGRNSDSHVEEVLKE